MVPSANKLNLLDLKGLPAANHYFIAISGGVDSMTLLHAMVNMPDIRPKLKAIHVNHNIDAESDQWALHCQNICDQYQVPLVVASVDLENHSENAARQARQQVFQQHLTKHDCLLTAHHMNDQAETLLFRLFRGTGLQGLTGMAQNNQLHHYQVFRPLLHSTRDSIEAYAQQHVIQYVKDPSNLDNRYSRNYIRNEIIPSLTEYHTDVIKQMSLTAENLSSSLDLLNHLIQPDQPLDTQTFQENELLSAALYHWLNAKGLITPSHKRLKQFAEDCLNAQPHKSPKLITDAYQLQQWQGKVYALKLFTTSDSNRLPFKIINDQPMPLPMDHGSLLIKAPQPIEWNVEIQFNQSSQSIQLSGHGQRKNIKNLFQERGIPPWERSCIPYLYIDNQLMAVGDVFLSEDFEALLASHQAQYHWLSAQIVL